MQILLGHNKECDKIHFALNALNVPNEIIYTGGGFYIVIVPVNSSLQIQINEHGATINDPQTGDYYAIISGETKPKTIAKQIARFYIMNK